MSVRASGLQELFLNSVRRARAPVAIFLVKGVKLQGVITAFDPFSIQLSRDGATQLIYKHAISTISPAERPEGLDSATPAADSEPGGKAPLQDQFLGAAARQGERMGLFLMNGVMLQGRVAAYDQFCLLLERGSQVQLVYKHAISTLQPGSRLDLGGAKIDQEQEEAL